MSVLELIRRLLEPDNREEVDERAEELEEKQRQIEERTRRIEQMLDVKRRHDSR